MSSQQGEEGRPSIVRGFVDRLEGAFAVVVTDEGEQILWPARLLSEGARPGSAVILAMVTDFGETERREAEVRALLRDIFDSPPPDTRSLSNGPDINRS